MSVHDEGLSEILAQHHYQLIKPIGQGQFGKVYLIKSLKYNVDFVLKRIQLKGNATGQDQEIESLQSLIHPNIINIYEHWTKDNCIYIIIEYCDRGSLWDSIKTGSPIPRHKLMPFCRQMLSAMDYFHGRGITHNDIKPANILVDCYDRPKFADFGMSLKLENGKLVNLYQGTPITMAPEIIKKEPYNPFLTDIWALGITFYMIAVGKHPWGSNNINDVIRAILNTRIIYPKTLPPEFVDMLRLMFAEKPEQRARPHELLSHPFFNAQQPPIRRNLSMTRISRTMTAQSSTLNIFPSSKRKYTKVTTTPSVPIVTFVE